MSMPSESLPVIPKVLIIDDDEIDQHLNRRIVKRSRLVGELVQFRTAEEALVYLGNQPDPADVIFLDINMPRMNGFEFLDRAIEELGPSFAKMIVIMLTTSLDPADSQRAAGYDVIKRFVNKPLTVELIEEVRLIVTNQVAGG